jgi:hypothetical protein
VQKTGEETMTARVGLLAIAGCLLLVAGCSKPAPATLTGTVRIDGKTVTGCKVIVYPDVSEVNPDKHGYGFGITDSEGKYKVQHPNGTPGIIPGRYKVAFIYWVDQKGRPVPADAKPSEFPGGVKNVLPPEYESPSTTPESIEVPAGGTTRDFDLKSK